MCGTNGFITGLGGLLVLPVTIPANVAGVIYVQLRMIAAIAHINGYDIYSDQVRTIAYACLTGSSTTKVLKNVGIKIGEKVVINVIKKIPVEVLVKINQQVGFRLVTKFGQKGLVNFGKMMPLVDGVFDTGMTLTIGNIAKKVFSE